MNIALTLIISALMAYLIGSINFAIIFSFLFKNQDIRLYGSKNAGTTNTIRVYGPLAGILVFLGDFLKSILAIYLCKFLFSSQDKYSLHINLISGLAVVIGHLFPIFFKFKGGKGSATSAGVILTQDINVFIIIVIVFLIFLFTTKIVALASISAAISYPIASLIFFKNYLVFIFSFLISILVVYAHRSNIKKLLEKTYNN